LFRFLARRIGDVRVLHLVTYRDDEIGGDHPLRLLLGDLATASAVHRMHLQPLSEEASHHLVGGSGRNATELHRLTGGNPFFLTEVLATNEAAVPATVGDAVLARAARLSPEARSVLDVAAVIGTTVDLDLLLAVAGPTLDEADECIARGLLCAQGDALVFRHALAREAILGALTPLRRRLLHARVLASLQEMPGAERDPARLSHHAEEAGDREAVLRHAVAAAEQAAALHAPREAAAQHARALRFGGSLPAAERARLFEGRALACYLIDQGAEAVAAAREAVQLWRGLGNAVKEGENLRWLSLCCELEGLGDEAEQAAMAARDVLEPLPPGPELAMAYSNLAQLRMFSHDLAGAIEWGERAIALAEQLGETPIVAHALISLGTGRSYAGDERGEIELMRGKDLALAAGLVDQAGRAFNNLAWMALQAMRLDDAERRFAAGIAYALEHDLDTYLWYLQGGQATLNVRRGAWDTAEQELRELLQLPRLSSINRIMALIPLGLLLTRRGDAEAGPVLHEALTLSDPTGQLSRLGPLRAVRAEAALLAGDRPRARAEAEAVREIVFAHGNRWLRGELAWLLWQTGERDVPLDDLAEPYALLIAGDYAGAAAALQKLGCPYEAAAALAASDDPALVKSAVAAFEDLGARPAIGRAMQHLRDLGVRDLPALRRGPQPSTRANPAGLTRREVEVLALVAAGLRNTEIAERLYLTPKTVGHHVSAIYGKLGVATRTEAVRVAARLGIIEA
jgi:DNA-binding CsgD family transcriptional regulator